ncbi:unnamed protein product [Rodentolepis nana]|uniref:DUF3506 domain-containing protein n=1 Tax=Rodentolepis nana TaxID=102285 RepID=A0A0R3TGQ9_RODNA|nr:unnamed protein product [Rodentolepis nana]
MSSYLSETEYLNDGWTPNQVGLLRLDTESGYIGGMWVECILPRYMEGMWVECIIPICEASVYSQSVKVFCQGIVSGT